MKLIDGALVSDTGYTAIQVFRDKLECMGYAVSNDILSDEDRLMRRDWKRIWEEHDARKAQGEA